MSNPVLNDERAGAASRAAHALRYIARDESLKAMIMSNPHYAALARRISARFLAGDVISDALVRARATNALGHACTIDYMGESCRDPIMANSETEEFIRLIEQIGNGHINSSISLDVSHIGSVIDPGLGHTNLLRIVKGAAQIGQEVMVSMEGSERTEATIETYAKACAELGSSADMLGITIQARMLRTDRDLEKLMPFPGRIRLVKGAYHEPADVAFEYDAAQTTERYLSFAKRLLRDGHKCSMATSDHHIQDELHSFIQSNGLSAQPFEFEILMGLGSERLDEMRRRGYATREYIVFGREWFLYVCNRIADRPYRALTAIADAIGHPGVELTDAINSKLASNE